MLRTLLVSEEERNPVHTSVFIKFVHDLDVEFARHTWRSDAKEQIRNKCHGFCEKLVYEGKIDELIKNDLYHFLLQILVIETTG